MDKVIENICVYYHINKDKVIEKTNKQEISIIRNYIYYILHYDYNFSIGQIAKKFNRCRREINYRVSEVKYRIEYFTKNKNEYNEILKEIGKSKGIN